MSLQSKQDALQKQFDRIYVLTNRMARVSKYAEHADNPEKAIRIALLIVKIVFEIGSCKANIMLISSQPLPDFKEGGIRMSPNNSGDEFIFPSGVSK